LHHQNAHSGYNDDIKRAAHGYEPTREAAMAVRIEMAAAGDLSIENQASIWR
jgi:hypothetical protein